ncbi:hypothetical protein [Nocardia sp. CS682]|nr:hypothetical protein [Nocardia sp. CS682]
MGDKKDAHYNDLSRGAPRVLSDGWLHASAAGGLIDDVQIPRR